MHSNRNTVFIMIGVSGLNINHKKNLKQHRGLALPDGACVFPLQVWASTIHIWSFHCKCEQVANVHRVGEKYLHLTSIVNFARGLLINWPQNIPNCLFRFLKNGRLCRLICQLQMANVSSQRVREITPRPNQASAGHKSMPWAHNPIRQQIVTSSNCSIPTKH